MTFNSAPASGHFVGAAFSYYWPAAFTADNQPFGNLGKNIWELKKLEIESQKIV